MPRNQKTRKPPTQVQKVRAIFDLWEFADLLNYRGGKKAFGSCHYDAVEWAYGEGFSNKQLILMPRGHLKSTIFTVLRILHRIYQNPDIRIFVGTSTKALASAFVRELKTYFEDDWLQENVWNNRPHFDGRLIPLMDRGFKKRRDEDDTEAEDKKIVWRGDSLQVIRPNIFKEPTIMVGSVGTISTGSHFDELFLDDVVTFDNVSTRDKIERVSSWIDDLDSVLDDEYVDSDLLSLYKEQIQKLPANERKKYDPTRPSKVGGVTTVVGTRYDINDYYGFLLRKPELGYKSYIKNIYKNSLDITDGYLWHEKFTKEKEDYLRSKMTSRRFASQYLNIIISTEDKVFSTDDIYYYKPDAITQNRGSNIIKFSPKPDYKAVEIPLVLVVDPAVSLSSRADYTAIGVGGITPDTDLVLVDLKMGKWKVTEWIDLMFDLCEQWALKAVRVETVALAKVLLQSIQEHPRFKKYPISVMEYKPPSGVGKKSRIESSLQPLFFNNKVYFPHHLAYNHELNDQINYFPRESVKDDGVDVISIIKEIAGRRVKRDASKPRRNSLDKYNKKWGGYL